MSLTTGKGWITPLERHDEKHSRFERHPSRRVDVGWLSPAINAELQSDDRHQTRQAPGQDDMAMNPRKHRIVIGKNGKPKAPSASMPAGQRKNQEAKARRLDRAWKAKGKQP